MSFVKALWICLLGTAVAFAEGVPFQVSSADLSTAEAAEDPQALITRLKQKAVVDWLKGSLGNRFDALADKITPEFAEKYILEYKVSRTGGPKGAIVLVGSLDSDSLKKFLRVTEVKARGSQVIRPLFILSSEAPSLPLLPKETAFRVRDGFGQALFSHLNAHFQKLNTSLTPVEGMSFSKPPKSPSDIRALAEAGAPGGYNGAIWAHLMPCRSCGGARLELFYYHFPQSRVALVRMEDIAADPRELMVGERARKLLKGVLEEFESEFDELVSQGLLSSQSHRVVVEGVDSYRLLKQLDTGIGKLDFVARALIKRGSQGVVEFEVHSAFSADELFQRFHLARFAGFQLKPLRQEGGALVLRIVR